MKKNAFILLALLFSPLALAETNHYLLQDGNHVQHLKISQLGDELTMTVDVDFSPNAEEQGEHACAAEISGEAKYIAENELLLRKHWDAEARYCNVNVKLSQEGAVIEQSEGCSYFVAGICHFSSGGRTLHKVQ